MGIVCPLSQAAVSARFLMKQTVFSAAHAAESPESQGFEDNEHCAESVCLCLELFDGEYDTA